MLEFVVTDKILMRLIANNLQVHLILIGGIHMSLIELRDVSVTYGSVTALENINLKVRQNEFLGIIGPNGGGKTTLLKVLLGIITPSKGTVKISSDIALGYVPQFTKFNTDFPITVLDVILTGRLPAKLRIFHRYSKQDLDLALSIMNRIGIAQFRNRQIGKLSGGQKQKVLIARALLTEPRILLLDEPTASLDSNAKNEIYNLLKEINKDKTVVMVSHDIGVISSYVDSVACLNKRLYYHGTDTKLSRDKLETTYGCPVELIAHGETPHRVLGKHEEDKND